MSFYDPTVGFRKTDQDFLNLCKQYRLLDGSTAVVAMIIDNKIITAHAGFVFFFLNQRTNLQRKKYNKKNKKKIRRFSRCFMSWQEGNQIDWRSQTRKSGWTRQSWGFRSTNQKKNSIFATNPKKTQCLLQIQKKLNVCYKSKKLTLLQIQKKLNACYKSKKLTLLQIQKTLQIKKLTLLLQIQKNPKKTTLLQIQKKLNVCSKIISGNEIDWFANFFCFF